MFKVVEGLSTQAISGCDFCDKFVEAIRPRRHCGDLDDGTVDLIILLSNRRHDVVPFQEEQEFVSSKQHICKKVVTAQLAVLKTGPQNCVTVKFEKPGLVFVERIRRLFDHHICLAATGFY